MYLVTPILLIPMPPYPADPIHPELDDQHNWPPFVKD